MEGGGIEFVTVVNFTPRPLYPRYPLDMRLGYMLWRTENIT
jgi:hypothetical protein